MFQQPISATLRPLFWLTVYLIVAFTIREPLIEHDTGWHLRTGQWILEHHEIPAVDPFSTVGDDRRWIAYSWLFGVILQTIHHSAGMTGILLLRVLLSLSIVAALHAMVARRQKSMLAQVLIVAGSAIALTSMFLAERPGLFTILFAIATIEAIFRITDDKRLGVFWLLPAVYALWANLHIQFVHGLFLIALAAFASAMRSITRQDKADWARTWRLLGLGLACGLATLLNPYGVRLYDVVLSYGSNREIYELFEELKAMRFRSPADWAVLAMFAAACMCMGRRPLILTELFLVAACAYLSFHAKHEVWLIVIASAAVLSRWPTSVVDAPLSWTEVAVIAGGVACAIAGWLTLGGLAEKQHEATRMEYPEVAIESTPQFLKGPIFVPIEWGGFVSWKTGQRVTIDGRAQLHGGPRVRRLYDVVAGRSGWRDDPDLRAAGSVLVPRQSPLARLLGDSPDYRCVYEDVVAAVYVPRRD